jgi:hypothetical protein
MTANIENARGKNPSEALADIFTFDPSKLEHSSKIPFIVHV